MQELKDLLSSTHGLRFLDAAGVSVTQQDFEARLKNPLKTDLADRLGAQNLKLVCSGQQLYVDYRRSVLSKIETLREMEQVETFFPFFLWVDTDRSGSDNLITKFAWPNSSKKGPITILPSRSGDIESRFVALDPAQLMSAIDKLETHLRQSGQAVDGAKQRYQQLRLIFTDDNPGTLSEFNLRLTDFLLNHVYGYVPRSVRLSTVIDQQAILAEINGYLNRIEAVVSVFNAAIQSLIQQGINPQVRPLAENYLPLFFSCEVDNQRLRLYHQIEGRDHFAVTACNCGRTYRFYLGRAALTIADIAQTGRWSPDVCFPIFFNDFVSGYVAGKSSALYLIVMNQVLGQVLDKTPVPVLIPPGLEQNPAGPAQFDSLIYRYLANGHTARHSGIFASSR